jgi:hypothetical protein
MWYCLDDAHQPYPCSMEMASALISSTDRTVARTTLGTCWVSTVFLVIAHGDWLGAPILFETMAFNTPVGDREQDWKAIDAVMGVDGNEESALGTTSRRYTTWDLAVAGHAEVVDILRFEERRAFLHAEQAAQAERDRIAKLTAPVLGRRRAILL